MNPTVHAVRVGLTRGWILFRHILTTADGLWNTAVWNGIPLVILILNRDSTVEGTSLSFAAVALPGFLGLMVAASALGPAYYIAAEREDGTLLRAKAVPNGIVGYVTGVLTQSCLETFIGVAILLVSGFLLFDGLTVNGVGGWIVFVAVIALGLLATLPVGVIIGSLVKSPRLIGGLGFLAIGAMSVVSGIFIPMQALPWWAAAIGQALPTYWVGLGMRSVFLPEAAASLEIGGTWRLPEMFVVLGAWAVIATLVAPVVLRRMARRASGASVEASRLEALQRL